MKLHPRFLLEGESGYSHGGGDNSSGGGASHSGVGFSNGTSSHSGGGLNNGNGAANSSSGFTPTYEGALRPDGTFAEGWTSKAFGADYKGPLAGVKDFTSLNKMLTDNISAARGRTEGLVRVPGADARPEEIAAFHKALGVPERADDYAHQLPEGVREEQLNHEQLRTWKGKLHAAGIPKKQAETLINDYLAEQAGQHAQTQTEFAQILEHEKAELARRFPEIDRTVSAVKALAQRPGIPASLKNAIAKGAFDPQNSAAFWGADALEVLAWAARATGEDATRGGGGRQGLTIAEAKSIMNDPGHSLHARYRAGDAEVTARISAAYAAGV